MGPYHDPARVEIPLAVLFMASSPQLFFRVFFREPGGRASPVANHVRRKHTSRTRGNYDEKRHLLVTSIENVKNMLLEQYPRLSTEMTGERGVRPHVKLIPTCFYAVRSKYVVILRGLPLHAMGS